jgi:hypothetical protein
VFGESGDRPGFLTLVPVEGQVHQIDYSQAQAALPRLRQAGTFHTHLWKLIDTGDPESPGWAGGGHSESDLANLLRRRPHMSAVVAQTRSGGRKVFLALRPQIVTVPEGIDVLASDYRRRVIAAVRAGSDPVDASELELARLGRTGIVAVYAGLDTPVLTRL